MPKTKKKSSASNKHNSENQSPQQPPIMSSLLFKLNRMIYLSDNTARYIAGNPELFFLRKYDLNFTFINDILKDPENVTKFLDVLRDANSNPRLPRRVTLIYVLAYALRHHSSDDKVTNLLSSSVLEICQTDEEFFKFISIFTFMGLQLKKAGNKENYNKITTSLSKIIKKFLEKKSPIEYANAVASSNGYHGWKYKDLIKLAHYKCESPEKQLVTDYVLRGIEALKETGDNELMKIQKIIQDWHKLRQPSHTTQEICNIIKELKATHRNVLPEYLKHRQVWAAIIPNIKVEEVLQLLPRFQKHNWLEETPEQSLEILNLMLQKSSFKISDVNPLEMFIYWKNFQKGGKAIDPKLEHFLRMNKFTIKTPTMVQEDNVISRLLSEHFHDLKSSFCLNKRVMVVLDVARYDSMCFKQRNVTCLEAELALATYFSSTEKDIDITVFNGSNLETFELEKGRDSFGNNLKRLKEVKPSEIKLFAPFDRAVSTRKNNDVFIYLLQTVKSLPSNPREFRKEFREAYYEYKQRNPDMDVKIVVICLGSHSLAPFPVDMDALTICGLCPEIPNVIHYFVN